MNYLSVCSGIEAATVAWHPLGWNPIAFSEIENFPAQVLAHHYPNTPNWGDMTKFKEWPDACVCFAGIDGKQNGSGRTSGDGGVGRVNVHTEHGGSTFRCDYCERFFAQYKCSASTHGECDCPKCQGFCACKQTKGTTCEKCGGAAINVLVGGTPCQSFSVAGLRKGLDDPRGNLMLTYLAIADKYRPEWVVWENVPGVLSSNGGRDFASFLQGLAELGYGFAYRILDAQYFGVAQRRRRVFVVGHIGDWRRAAAVLFERHSLQGHPAPRREKGQKATASFRACPPASGGQGTDAEHTVMMLKDVAPCLDAMMDKKWGSNQWVDSGQFVFCAFDGQKNASIQNNLAPTFTKQDEQPYVVGTIGARTGLSIGAQDAANGHMIPTNGGVFDVAHSLTRRYDSSEDGTGRGTPLVPIQNALRGKSQNGLGIGEGGEPMYTLDKTSQHAVGFSWQKSTISTTLDKSTTPAVHHAMQVRRLTPKECERLQGFPDDYTLVPYRKKPAADGPRYKSLGNSMAVPVMRWIGERIKQVEGL